jgi:hypothetical protein
VEGGGGGVVVDPRVQPPCPCVGGGTGGLGPERSASGEVDSDVGCGEDDGEGGGQSGR